MSNSTTFVEAWTVSLVTMTSAPLTDRIAFNSVFNDERGEKELRDVMFSD